MAGQTVRFLFLVVGDSGSGSHRGHSPQRRLAEQMENTRDRCRFMLHTGDVIYLVVGSSGFYEKLHYLSPIEVRIWRVTSQTHCL